MLLLLYSVYYHTGCLGSNRATLAETLMI